MIDAKFSCVYDAPQELGKEVLYDAQREICAGDGWLAGNWPRYRPEAGGMRREGCRSLLSERRSGQGDSG